MREEAGMNEETEQRRVRGIAMEKEEKRKRGEPPVTAYPPVLISRCLQITDKITCSR